MSENRVRLPTVDQPVLSVIVLAWRLEDELLECLRGLSRQVDVPEFEVVVVENGATDAVRHVLTDRVEGAVIVSSDSNLGFGGGCDLGAAAARGEFLVFLNDDVRVDGRWLGFLAERASRSDAPVAVGSLLLNHDGTVQEVGSRVLSDGGTVQFGRGLDVDTARTQGLLESREVDYCSAAALLVTREAFDAADGFDDVYAPAYFEDVDLQFRMRLAGGIIVVEPSAVVHHTGGGSTGDRPYYRQFLGTVNGRTFIERWSNTLAAAPSPEADVREVGVVMPPRLELDVDPTPEASHPRVAAAYEAWLEDRLGESERAHADLAARFDALQHKNHDDLQHAHAMKVHIEHLESRTLSQQMRERFTRHRDGPGD